MLPEYRQMIEEGLKRLAETKKLFAHLKKKKPANLDDLVGALHTRAFDLIDCLKCGNCCRSLGPRISDRDVARISKTLRQKPSQFTESYLKIDEEGDYVFSAMPCPFINPENYCRVYADRPQACAGYPHTDRRRFVQLLDITLLNIKICPAVAWMTLAMRKHIAG